MNPELQSILAEILNLLKQGIEKIPESLNKMIISFGQYKLITAVGYYGLALVLIAVGIGCAWGCKVIAKDDEEGFAWFIGFISFCAFVGAFFCIIFGFNSIAAGLYPYGYLFNRVLQ